MASIEDMTNAQQASMRQRTGRDMDQWVQLVEASGTDPLDQLAVRRWLKAEHDVGQNTQWAIAFEAATRHGWVEPTPEQYADQMYAGRKQVLRPLHDALVAAALATGEDTHLEARSSYTPVVRRRQFAAVGPGPRATVRVGLRFTDAPDHPRLEPAKGFAQATHWVQLAVDDEPEAAVAELEPLLHLAWRQNG